MEYKTKIRKLTKREKLRLYQTLFYLLGITLLVVFNLSLFVLFLLRIKYLQFHIYVSSFCFIIAVILIILHFVIKRIELLVLLDNK